MQAKKTCVKCKHDKRLSEFSRRTSSDDGRHYYCLECQRLGNKETYEKHRESRIARQKMYYQERADKDQIRMRSRAYQVKHAERLLGMELQKKYGLSLAEYKTILSNQGGGCAICGAVQKKRRLSVDHCHDTQKVRGILCGKCNMGLGQFNHDPDLIRKVITYLKSY